MTPPGRPFGCVDGLLAMVRVVARRAGSLLLEWIGGLDVSKQEQNKEPAPGRRRVTFFKKVPGTDEVYGGKVFVGNLDRACRRLVKKFGGQAEVRVLGPGLYEIAGGDAEMEVVRDRVHNSIHGRKAQQAGDSLETLGAAFGRERE